MRAAGGRAASRRVGPGWWGVSEVELGVFIGDGGGYSATIDMTAWGGYALVGLEGREVSEGKWKSFGVVRTCGVLGGAPVWEFVAGIRGYDVVGWIGKKFLAGIGLIGSRMLGSQQGTG